MPFSNVRGKKLCMELVNDKNERHTGVKLIEGSLSQNIKIKIVLQVLSKKKKVVYFDVELVLRVVVYHVTKAGGNE